MPRWLRLTGVTVGAVLGAVIVLVILALVGANTPLGHRLLAAAAAKFSDGEITLGDIGGRFPDKLAVGTITLRDNDGIWATADGARLDWSPLALLRGDLHVMRLEAARIALQRLPQQTASSSSTDTLPPLQIDLDRLLVQQLELAPAVAGSAATLRLAGNAHILSLQRGSIALDAERVDAPGHYAINAVLDGEGINADAEAHEPAQGLIAGLAGIAAPGPIALDAHVDGPRNAEELRLHLAAGALHADGTGIADLDHNHLDLDLSGGAPAMALRPDLHWNAASLEAHIHGDLTRPDATGKIAIDRLTAGTVAFARLEGQLQGNAGEVRFGGTLAGLQLPAPAGDLFAAAPMSLNLEATLDTPERRLRFSLAHPLLTLTGTANTGNGVAGDATLTAPELAPLARLTGLDLAGDAQITAHLAQQEENAQVALDGTAHITGGEAPLAALLGRDTRLSLTARKNGNDLTIDHAQLDGQALHATVTGSDKSGTIDAQWRASLATVTPLVPSLSGSVSVEGSVTGPEDHLAVSANAKATIGAPGFAPAPVTASIRLEDLPHAPSGRIEAQGTLLGAPLTLATRLQQSDGALRLAIDRAQWKSATASGTLALSQGATLPTGQLSLRMSRLDELRPLLDMPLGGNLTATIETTPSAAAPQLHLRLDGRNLAVDTLSIGTASLEGRIDDPLGAARVAAQLRLTDVASNGITGTAALDANGPITALALRLAASAQTDKGAAKLTAQATANVAQRALRMTALTASYGGENARLLAPARFALADGASVSNLRLGIGQATLNLDGRLTPNLALTAAMHNVTPALAQPFVPSLQADGTFALDAKLGGTIAAPTGNLHLTGRGLRWHSPAGRGIAAAALDATAALNGTGARLDLRIDAGNTVRLRLDGMAPLQPNGALDLHANGAIDLVALDPILTPNGRNARGAFSFALAVAGNLAAPRVTGSATLSKASVQDFAQGIQITAMNGTFNADGESLRIVRLTGRAGSGTLSVSGSVDLLAPGMPVDLTVTAQNARPLASDELTATMNGALKITGEAMTHLDIAGTIRVSEADINIPESFPQSVAVLNVERPGQAPPPPPAPSLTIGLALTIEAPERIFVRGHGIDAEFGGTLKVTGATDAPQVSGGFDLRRGTFSLAGQTLTFTRGRISFNGSGPSGKLNPTLNLVAESTANGVTATLAISGYADSPKIALTSSPSLPQDEILAQLFFGQSVKQLTPLQVAQIAQALASLSGVGGGLDPLAMVRKGLGLDRLSVGAASGNTSGATVEAGKYIANGVYVGTKQGISGGTQGQVQIDLTKNLKLQTTLGTGGSAPATGATPDNDPGSSIGLSYQFEY